MPVHKNLYISDVKVMLEEAMKKQKKNFKTFLLYLEYLGTQKVFLSIWQENNFFSVIA